MTCSIEWGFHVTKCHHVLLKIQNMSPCWVSHHFRCWETLTSWRWDNRDPKATRSGQCEHIVSLLWEAWEKNGNIGTPMGRVKKLKCHGFPRGFHRILFGYGFCQLLFGYGSTGSTVYSMVTKYCFNLIFLLLSFFVSASWGCSFIRTTQIIVAFLWHENGASENRLWGENICWCRRYLFFLVGIKSIVIMCHPHSSTFFFPYTGLCAVMHALIVYQLLGRSDCWPWSSLDLHDIQSP